MGFITTPNRSPSIILRQEFGNCYHTRHESKPKALSPQILWATWLEQYYWGLLKTKFSINPSKPEINNFKIVIKFHDSIIFFSSFLDWFSNILLTLQQCIYNFLLLYLIFTSLCSPRGIWSQRINCINSRGWGHPYWVESFNLQMS